MVNLETMYMGLKLKNPVIVSSSGLTSSVESIKKIEEQGASAVVLKSLFEEQLHHEAGSIISNSGTDYPEAEDYIRNYAKNNSIDKYLDLIEGAKKEVSIPVIASVNCISNRDWTDFAQKIEQAGADGIELNINIVPTDPLVSSEDIEKQYYKIYESVSEKINIPVSVKIGYHFSNLLYVVNQLQYRGLKGVVLFNRFYEPDIDVDKMKMVSSDIFSKASDIRHSIRWVGLISDKIEDIDVSASTGVHNAEGAMKQILAGASTVQICSVLYKNGLSEISKILKELEELMTKKGFSSIEDCKGNMSYKNISDPATYERSQFMKYFSEVD